MSDLPTVSSLWIGPRLSFLEQLCLKSFVDAGHPTKLYAYARIGGVPEGVELADANEVLPSSEFVVNRKTGAPGPHADKFRYHLLEKTAEIWADTDAYCLAPFPDREYLVARHFKDVFANGVLRLPQGSATLHDLLNFTASEYPDIPEDFALLRGNARKNYDARRGQMHVSELPWEIWGPFAITYFLRRNDEDRHELPGHVFYPLAGGEIRRVLQMPRRAMISLPEDCLSIHFYGSKIRGLLEMQGGVPATRSLLGQLCEKHGIDPRKAPISLEKAHPTC